MRKKILLLGSGELGKELVIAMQRLGQYVIAVDNYENAPAMQVAHEYEVINMLDGSELDRIVKKHQPDYIVPEVESIRTERFYDYEEQGYNVIPSAKAANFTMNRKSIRDLAAVDLGVKTAKYKYATSFEELKTGVKFTGIPCVVKPLMSSSGKGQSVIKDESDIEKAWNYAMEGSRGDLMEVIVEEFVEFDYEITLLTLTQNNNKTLINSAHHQGVDKLGNNLNVTGMAPDGIIEGFEHESHYYCVGVQWHPEFLITDFDKKFIQDFVNHVKKNI